MALKTCKSIAKRGVELQVLFLKKVIFLVWRGGVFSKGLIL
jgi:hypothetical protein